MLPKKRLNVFHMVSRAHSAIYDINARALQIRWAGLAIRTLIEKSMPASITDSSTGVAALATTFMPVAPSGVIDATANAKALSATVQTAYSSGNYEPGDVIATNEDTGTEPTFTVLTTKVHSATTDASGSVGNDGNWIVEGTTGTGTKWTGTAATSSGTLGAITLTNAGSYTVNPTLSGEPVTLTPNGGGAAGPATGYTVTNTMGVNTVGLTTPGSVSVIHSNPVTTAAAVGSGATGLTLNVSWSAGVLYSLVNTALTTLSQAEGDLGKSLNLVAAFLGLPQMTFDGITCSAGTIAGVTQSEVALTPGSGATAADYVTAVAAMVVLRNNMSTLIRFFGQLLVATGFLPLTDFTGGSPWNSAIPNPGVPPYGADPNIFSAGSNDQPWRTGTFNDADRGQGPQPRNCRVLYLFQWRKLARPSPAQHVIADEIQRVRVGFERIVMDSATQNLAGATKPKIESAVRRAAVSRTAPRTAPRGIARRVAAPAKPAADGINLPVAPPADPAPVEQAAAAE